jgi:hypothetical protein
MSLNLYAQDWDDDDGKNRKHHNKEHHKKNDYFTIGLYGGSYMAKYPLYEKNRFLNSVSLELEYFKFKDLSLYLRAVNEFTQTDLYALEGFTTPQNLLSFKEPSTNRFVISFGGRYYLNSPSKRKISPYLQLGMNHESNYIGEYSYIYNLYRYTISPYYLYRFAANLGVGVNVKIAKKFSFDIKYDIYKTLGRSREDSYYVGSTPGFNGFSVLAGIKYNL